MWKPYLVTNEAEGFAAALDGWPTAVGADALVTFVRELSAAVRADSASPSERGRARLLAAVAARREETKYRALAPLPARAGTLLAATLAGGGLLAAAAANGADPIAFVRQAVQDVTHIVHLPPVFGEPQTAPAGTLAEVNIEGVITALTSAGAKFDLAYDTGEIRVELHDDTLLRLRRRVPGRARCPRDRVTGPGAWSAWWRWPSAGDGRRASPPAAGRPRSTGQRRGRGRPG